MQAPKPKSGKVIFREKNLTIMNRRRLRESRRNLQMVFQDPFSSLDARWQVSDLIAEPLDNYRIGTVEERGRKVDELLQRVGLDPNRYRTRRPRQLSGGQCQRVAIARALSLGPELLICDEAVSSMDVSIQAQILNLLRDLREDLDLAYVFIGHDLAVVKYMSDAIAVMYLGRICEIGPADDLYANPRHPYTAALLTAIPNNEGAGSARSSQQLLEGDLPSPLNPPSGCRFRTRCPRAQVICAEVEPLISADSEPHQVACHFPLR